MLLADRHPELVGALVAIDPVYALPARRRQGFRARAGQLAGIDAAAVASAHFAGLDGPRTPAHLRVWHQRRPYAVAQHVIRGTVEGFEAGPDSIRLRPEADAVLLRRRVPVLAVHRTSVQAAVDRALCPHPESVIHAWPGTGHWLHQEHPLRFHRAMRRWLGW